MGTWRPQGLVLLRASASEAPGAWGMAPSEDQVGNEDAEGGAEGVDEDVPWCPDAVCDEGLVEFVCDGVGDGHEEGLAGHPPVPVVKSSGVEVPKGGPPECGEDGVFEDVAEFSDEEFDGGELGPGE